MVSIYINANNTIKQSLLKPQLAAARHLSSLADAINLTPAPLSLFVSVTLQKYAVGAKVGLGGLESLEVKESAYARVGCVRVYRVRKKEREVSARRGGKCRAAAGRRRRRRARYIYLPRREPETRAGKSGSDETRNV